MILGELSNFYIPVSSTGNADDISFNTYQLGVFVVVQSLSHVQLYMTPWTAAHQTSLSFTTSRSLLKFMSIESMMLCNHLILCHPLLFLPSISPIIGIFSSESTLHIRWPKYWSFSFKISNDYLGLIFFPMII